MLQRRVSVDDGVDDDEYYDGDSWWYTRDAYIVKWVVFLVLAVGITVYFIGGRAHARRRVRSGRMPVRGTAWLLSRAERGLVDPRFATAPPQWPGRPYYGQPPQQYGQNPQGGSYGMQNMAPPPPVYDGQNRPPMYDGPGGPAPDGGSKVDPAQSGAYAPVPSYGPSYGPSSGPGDFAPPPGPPPGR